MKQSDPGTADDPAWLQVCAAAELDPQQRMAARVAILNHPDALDCTLYRADETDEDAEEEDLGDARILFIGAFQTPQVWSDADCAEYFDGLDPALFVTAYIECEVPAASSAFFLPEIGDYVATMTADGVVEMYFVHDCNESADGTLCVLIRDEEPLF